MHDTQKQIMSDHFSSSAGGAATVDDADYASLDASDEAGLLHGTAEARDAALASLSLPELLVDSGIRSALLSLFKHSFYADQLARILTAVDAAGTDSYAVVIRCVGRRRHRNA